MRHVIGWALLCLVLGAGRAEAGPWSITLYGGPATHTIFTDFLAGRYTWDSGMIALAADRRIAHVGWGIDLVAEGQIQQFAFGHGYTSLALGIGGEFHGFPWKDRVPTTVSIFAGPTYSFGPPQIYPSDEFGSRKSLLNYVSLEVAVGLPQTRHWDVVFRIYHRSGMWGIYTLDPDEVTVIGGGIRLRL
ncbi:MAG TPA: hypothetical protein VMU08_13165 [Rhizomicrobium sp.]|nr:hypothetical protein [Rhizomicrobium sp.]